MTDFDPHWVHGHITRDGRKARVICTDAMGLQPVVALVQDAPQIECPRTYTRDGRFFIGGPSSVADLLNAPAPKKKGYAVVHADDVYASREEALAAALEVSTHSFACIQVEEGQGLEGDSK